MLINLVGTFRRRGDNSKFTMVSNTERVKSENASKNYPTADYVDFNSYNRHRSNIVIIIV